MDINYQRVENWLNDLSPKEFKTTTCTIYYAWREKDYTPLMAKIHKDAEKGYLLELLHRGAELLAEETFTSLTGEPNDNNST